MAYIGSSVSAQVDSIADEYGKGIRSVAMKDQWIPWDGNGVPDIDWSCDIMVKYRNGHQTLWEANYMKKTIPNNMRSLWLHEKGEYDKGGYDKGGYDIVAYRVI